MPTEDQVRSALAHVKYPGFSRDIVAFGLIKGIRVEGKNVQVDISLATKDANIPRQIHDESMRAKNRHQINANSRVLLHQAR